MIEEETNMKNKNTSGKNDFMTLLDGIGSKII